MKSYGYRALKGNVMVFVIIIASLMLFCCSPPPKDDTKKGSDEPKSSDSPMSDETETSEPDKLKRLPAAGVVKARPMRPAKPSYIMLQTGKS